MNDTDNRTRAVKNPMTLSVGPEQGDLRGDDDRTLQAAADYLHRLGYSTAAPASCQSGGPGRVRGL